MFLLQNISSFVSNFFSFGDGGGGGVLDTFIEKTKKLYLDSRTQRNIAKLNDELYEVQQIMTRNVQEVLGVGEKLDRKFSLAFFFLSFYFYNEISCYMSNILLK